MATPQVNAELLAIHPIEFSEEMERVETTTVLWEGSVGCYYQERRQWSAATAEDYSLERRLYLMPDEPPFDFEPGEHRVVYEFKGVEHTARVAQVQEIDLPGQPVLGTTRLTLQVE